MSLAENKELFCKPEEERALLSFAVKDINFFYDLHSKMDEEDFLYPEHKFMFILMKELLNKGAEKFDMSLILSTAKHMEILPQLGGVDYVHSICNMKIHEKNYDLYMKDVLEASTKYRLYNILQDNIEDVKDNAKSSTESIELIGQVENKVLDLSTDSKAISEPLDFADGLKEYIEERRLNAVDVVGLSTGFSVLDNQIDGMIPGTLFIIAARKKVGKSAFLTNISARVAYNMKTPVLYVDTELTFNEWRPRVIASLSNVEERVIKHGGYGAEQHNEILEKCIQRVENGLLYHEYMPGYSLDKLVALYKKYKIKHNIGLMVFDYLKEPSSTSVDRNRKEHQVLGDVTTKLKDLAGELNIPALTAVQLNRSGDVADSDRIARYGDIVAFWQAKKEDERKEENYQKGSHKLVIKDTRRGGSTGEGGISYFFFKKQLLIKEVRADMQPNNYGSVVDNESDDLSEYIEDYGDNDLI
jgi:replicative DNA helicase